MAASSASTSFGASWGGLIASGVANTISAFGSFGLQKTKNAIAQSQANIARINACLYTHLTLPTIYSV